MTQCKFCSGETPYFSSGKGLKVPANSFEVKGCNTGEAVSLDYMDLVNVLLGKRVEIELKISYCPMCGRRLSERNEE